MRRVKVREEATQIARKLMDSGYFVSVLSDGSFRDDPNMFYRFSEQLENNELPVAPLTPTHIRSIDDLSVYKKQVESKQDEVSRQAMIDEEEKRKQEQERVLKLYLRQEQEESARQKTTMPEVSEPTISPQETQPATPTQTPVIEAPKQETNTLSQSSEEKTDDQEDAPDKPKKVSPLLKNFVKQMREPETGVSIKDRVWHFSATHFTTYNRCFVGTELVDWLVKNKSLHEREHAVKIGQKLMTAGLFHHVTDTLPFLDGHYFYRFKEDD